MSNAMAEREAEQAEAMYHRLARLVAGMVYGPEVLLANTPEGPLTEEEKRKHAEAKAAEEAAAAAEAEAEATKAAAAKATGEAKAAAVAKAKAAKEAAKKAQEYATTKGDASSRLTKALPYNHDKGMAMVVEVLLDAPFANEDEEATAAHGDRRPRDPKDRSRLLQLDEEIAQRLKLSARQVRRYLAVLKADRLAKQYAVDKKHGAPKDEFADPRREGELKAGDVTALYGIDFNDLADAIHFKLDEAEQKLTAQENAATNIQLYRCPNDDCLGVRNEVRTDEHPKGEVVYSSLDFDVEQTQQMVTDGFWSCPVCRLGGLTMELEELDANAAAGGVQSLRAKWVNELKVLREALLHAEEFDPPVYKRPTRGDADAAGSSGVGGKRKASGSHGAGSSGNFTLGASMYNDDDGAESKPMLEMPKWMMTAGQSAASDAAKASSAADAAAAAETAAASAAFMQAYKAAPTVKEEEPSLEAIFGGPSSSAAPAPQASLQPTKSSSYEEEDPDDNGPMVMVDGVEKGFYSVTEEDQERMSIEEHDAYAKLHAELA